MSRVEVIPATRDWTDGGVSARLADTTGKLLPVSIVSMQRSHRAASTWSQPALGAGTLLLGVIAQRFIDIEYDGARISVFYDNCRGMHDLNKILMPTLCAEINPDTKSISLSVTSRQNPRSTRYRCSVSVKSYFGNGVKKVEREKGHTFMEEL